MISGILWGPVTPSTADRRDDHDGQALAYNSLILHLKYGRDRNIVMNKSVGSAGLFGGFQGEI